MAKNTCRFCLSLDELYPLFPVVQHRESYKRALYLITGLKIEPSDGLPQRICRKCATIVENGMTFRKQCRQVENRLLNSNKLGRKSKTHGKEKTVNDKKENIQTKTKKSSTSNTIQEPTIYNVHKGAKEANNNTNTDDKSYVNDDQETEDEIDNIDEFEQNSATKNIVKPQQTAAACLELLEDPTNEELRKCKLCSKTYKSLNGFRNHARLHLGFGITCEFCGFRCNASTTLMRHLRALHGAERDNQFPCSFCDYKALDKEQLEAHERHIHTKERPHVCDECGDAFFTKKVLVQHQFRHKSERPFQCHICPSKFKRLGQLNLHKRRYHDRNYKYYYGCYVCEKSYVKCTSARKHLLKFHGIAKDQQGKLLHIKTN